MCIVNVTREQKLSLAFRGAKIIMTTWRKTALQAEPEAQLEVVDNATLLPLPVTKNNITPVDYKTNKHILLVDDNQELRNFLKGAFEKQYHIYEAQDGNAALETAKEKVPDVIISDVMMPGMNGIELCKRCKQTFETSHIPFIISLCKRCPGY